MVFDLPTVPGAKPTLRGIGWAQPWVAANNTATIVIGTRRPTEPLVQRFGLTKQDGSPMFKLRTTPATGVTRTPRQLTSGAARTSSAGQCRARTDRVLTTIRCFQPAFSKGLCGTHLLQARSSAVYDYLTGKRIVL